MSLTNCGVGDVGGESFCRVLSRQVEMKKDEIALWRQNRMDLIISSDSQLQISPSGKGAHFTQKF